MFNYNFNYKTFSNDDTNPNPDPDSDRPSRMIIYRKLTYCRLSSELLNNFKHSQKLCTLCSICMGDRKFKEKSSLLEMH